MNTELLKSKLLEAAFNGSLTHADISTWEFPKIGDIAFTTSGGTPQAKNKEYYESGNIRWIRSGELGVKYIYDSEIKITQKALENSSAKYYPVDSVLIALYGATVGKVAILKAESTSNQAVCAIFPNERFTPEYMYYFLSSQRDNFLGIASGGAQSNISQEKVKNSIIPLPSIAEQQRIVAALEEGFTYIDAVASAKQNLSNTAELLRNKILQAAFDGSLTGADTSTWEDVKLRKVTTKIVDGDHNPPKGEEDPTPYIMLSSQNINDDTYVAMNKVRYLSKENFDMCNKRTHLTKGDVLLTSVGTIGRSCVHNSDEVYCFQRSVTIITPTINSYFLKYYFDSPAFQQMLNMSSTGNAQKGFYLNKLKEVLIPLPSPEEQQRIVAKIDELFTQIDKISN